ncbi:ankyrin repeat domain-containing protein 50-like [Corticium candelabrum]|uniref:ankyrin repeat domain-containing protein 50-like n=1 Tax=Corticium candelabrum TaxID=121492 RepID=UPI002E25D9E0|nr:ankyrin repeat domain-containing protein 50-like [Corticium candelabrum]
MQACWYREKEMVEFLLTKSADVNVAGRCGETALIVSASIGSEEITDLLLNVKDINVMKGDNLGRTAIHYAAMNNHVTIVERLLYVPVDINDNDGCTPLWYAVFDGHVYCVDVLLKHGVSPQHESKSEGSPLKVAKRCGHSDVVEMMEEAIRLTSHPYVEGRMFVTRHQDQQTIAELQSEVEKKTEELGQSSLVHESEVTRLRNEMQQKEKETGDGQVAPEAWLLSQSPGDVMGAVVDLACDQWSDVGLN